MIAIVDYGVGNLYSLKSSLDYLHIENTVTDDEKAIADADRIILPGVGAFEDAVKKMHETGMFEAVKSEALKGKPLLGICLGMQLLFEKSYEGGEFTGLGLLSGDIISISEKLTDKSLKVPQIGWNDLTFKKASPLLKYLKEGDFVYYVHSFYKEVDESTVAYSDYGNINIAGLVEKNKIYGTQFHPEKSGKTGLFMLKAFNEIF